MNFKAYIDLPINLNFGITTAILRFLSNVLPTCLINEIHRPKTLKTAHSSYRVYSTHSSIFTAKAARPLSYLVLQQWSLALLRAMSLALARRLHHPGAASACRFSIAFRPLR